jgi:hypothetical protein
MRLACNSGKLSATERGTLFATEKIPDCRIFESFVAQIQGFVGTCSHPRVAFQIQNTVVCFDGRLIFTFRTQVFLYENDCC